MKLLKLHIEEGITTELIGFVKNLKTSLPAILDNSEDAVNFLRMDEKHFWQILPDGSYVKDAKNNFMLFPADKVWIGRARYFLRNKENLIAEKKASFKTAMVKKVKLEIELLLQKYTEIYFIAYNQHVFPEFNKLATELTVGYKLANSWIDKKNVTSSAKEFLDNSAEIKDLMATIYQKYVDVDFEFLYHYTEQNSLGLIFSGSKNDNVFLSVLKQLFHKDKIEQTAQMSLIDQICAAKAIQFYS